MQDIVVVGRRYRSASGVVITNYNYVNNSSNNETSAYVEQDNTDPEVSVIKVNVKIANPNNEAKAKEAAQNVADAVTTIINACQGLPANTVIPLPKGQSTTAGALLDDVKNTAFIVSDTQNFGNNGVGGADHASMTDNLFFGAFAEGTGYSSYSNSQWSGQGIIGTILHELGHLSEFGFTNRNNEVQQFNNEMTQRHAARFTNDYYLGSDAADYRLDEESYAQAYALSAASVLGLNIGTYDSILVSNGLVTTFQGPSEIFNQHKSDLGF